MGSASPCPAAVSLGLRMLHTSGSLPATCPPWLEWDPVGLSHDNLLGWVTPMSSGPLQQENKLALGTLRPLPRQPAHSSSGSSSWLCSASPPPCRLPGPIPRTLLQRILERASLHATLQPGHPETHRACALSSFFWKAVAVDAGGQFSERLTRPHPRVEHSVVRCCLHLSCVPCPACHLSSQFYT